MVYVNMTNQIQARAVIQILNAPRVEIKVNLYVCGVTSMHFLQTVLTTLQAVKPTSQPGAFHCVTKTVPEWPDPP